MTALTEFSFGSNGIRVFGTKWDPWFVGKDVCDVLGYKNSRDAIAKHVDEEDKGVAKCDTLGGEQTVVIINESGLYALIFGSDLPAAKQFKRWVTHEVLPQIRKTGKYIPPQPKKPRGRQRVAYEIADGKKLFLSDLRVRCAEYEGVCVNKSSYRKAPAEECVAYINQKIADGARIDYDVDDYGADETYWIVADGKRIEIPM